ncbi:MAG: hypothetical protein BJ554DRAFT_7339, partial [Olpidium bornovanus]
MSASHAPRLEDARDFTVPAAVHVTEHMSMSVFDGVSELVATITAMLLLVSEQQLGKFLRGPLAGRSPDDRAEFLVKMNRAFVSMVETAYPTGWLNIIQLAHKAAAKTLKSVAGLMQAEYNPVEAASFRVDLWESFFEAAHALIASPHVQVERFGAQKRSVVEAMNDNIRGDMADLVLAMWSALAELRPAESQQGKPNYQGVFGFQLVGYILDLAMVDHEAVRKCAIQILYDMFCNRYIRDGNVADFEAVFIAKLDKAVMSGLKGDDTIRRHLISELTRKFREQQGIDSGVCPAGFRFVASVDQLFQLLLDVRSLPETEEYDEERMVGTLKVMRFISHIQQDVVYVKYVHLLAQMQLRNQNYLEAAQTLKMHSNLLAWDPDEQLTAVPELALPAQTAFDRKEHLFKQMTNHFNEGKGWEMAIQACKELINQYETKVFQYQKVADVSEQLATFYRSIM